jgi:hypothetical protein
MVLQQESLLVFHLLLYTTSALCYWNNKSTSLFIQEGPWKLHYLNHFNWVRLFKPDSTVFWSLLFNMMSYAAICKFKREL